MLRESAELMAKDRGFRLAAILATVWLATAFNIGLALADARLAYVVYWIAVGGFSLLAGPAAGAVALCASTLCVLYFFVPPTFSFRITSPPEALLLLEYMAVGALICGMVAIWRRWRGGRA
jgi:K+-sensing histidine kinase KdpD